MRVKASITHTCYFEVPEGISIEDVRKEALGEINDGYTDEDGQSFGSPSDNVQEIFTQAIKVGSLTSSVLEVRVTEDE